MCFSQFRSDRENIIISKTNRIHRGKSPLLKIGTYVRGWHVHVVVIFHSIEISF